MQSLYSPKNYPTNIRLAIEGISPLAVEIANRWMLGWPQTVRGLLATGEYLDALKRQEAEERTLLSSVDLRHLARHEICDLYGLSPKPPAPSQDRD